MYFGLRCFYYRIGRVIISALLRYRYKESKITEISIADDVACNEKELIKLLLNASYNDNYPIYLGINTINVTVFL